METVRQNLEKLFSQACGPTLYEGANWYRRARIRAYDISRYTGMPLLNVCGVIAALSPRNKWERNLIDAHALCSGFTHKYGTFGANVRKAKAILNAHNTAEICKILGGRKTKSFFLNLYDADSSHVTVDVHMHLAALGEYIKEENRPSLTNRRYTEIEEAIKTIAKNYNGWKPHEVQAVIWLAWRESK